MALVEALKPGQLGKADALIATGAAARDGLPVHLGLGTSESVDLRVTLAPGVTREMRGVKSDRLVEVNLAQCRAQRDGRPLGLS